MWIQITNEYAKELLKVQSGDRAVQHVQERAKHYLGLESAVARRFRKAAREQSRDGELEVDIDAVVSVGGDPGAYVMAWKWIANEEAGFGDSQVGSEKLKL